MKRNMTRRRLTALVVIACFVMVTALSGAFIAMHLCHGHDHANITAGCGVCTRLQSARNLIDQLCAMLLTVGIIALCLCIFVNGTQWVSTRAIALTPVRLKIRMNN